MRARVENYQFKVDSDDEEGGEEAKTPSAITPDKPSEAEISEMEK